jgi:hypothetical protein
VSRFEVVPVKDGGLLGGHYAVEHVETKRVVGRSFRLDQAQADILRFELDRVYEYAQREAANDQT